MHKVGKKCHPSGNCSSRRRRTRASVIALLLATLSPLGEAGERAGIAWQDALVIATGAAHKGRWRMNQSDYRYVDDPSVALREDGTAAIVWVDQAQQDVFLQRYDRDGQRQLEAETNVSRSAGTFSWLPRVLAAANSPDTFYVLWQEIIFSGGTHGGEILFARSEDGGRTFTQPINLSNTKNGAGKGRLTKKRWDNGSLDLAEGSRGEIWAAWTEYEGRLRISRSSDGGRSFSKPKHIAGSHNAPARGPSIAVDDEGKLHLAWAVGENPSANIHYAVFDSRDGSVRGPLVVGRSEGYADAPKVALDVQGVVHLAYVERPKGPWQQGHIRYTQARSGARFQAPKEVSSGHANGIASVGFPSLAVSGTHVYVLWELFPDPGYRSRGLGITLSVDSGQYFAEPEVVPRSGASSPGCNGSLQGMLMRKLAANRAGNIAVVNSTFHEGERSVVRLIRGQVNAGT